MKLLNYLLMSSVILCATQSQPMSYGYGLLPSKTTLSKIITKKSLNNMIAVGKMALGTGALIASPFIGNLVYHNNNTIDEECSNGGYPHCYGCIKKHHEAVWAGFSLFAITAIASCALLRNGYNQLKIPKTISSMVNIRFFNHNYSF